MTPDEQRLDSLLAVIPQGVQENDLNGVITYSNPSHHKMLGYEPGELLGKTIFDLLYDINEREKLKEYLAYLVSEQPEPTPYISKTQRKDGSFVLARVDWNYQRNEQEELIGFVSVISDITEQQTLQETLREERNLALNYLDVSHFMMVVLDSSGNITLVNRAACDVLGYRADQLLHSNWFETCLPENERQSATQAFHALMNGDMEIITQYESSILTSTGEERLINWRNTLQRDSEGNSCGIISAGEDITDKRLAREEKARLDEQIKKVQQMEALGRLTSGIAHDFNNILASILGYADLTLDALSELGEHELCRYINEVISEGEKARDLITQMLAFARATPGGDIAMNPAPLVKEQAKIIQASLADTIELEINAETDIPKVLVDPLQLHHAIVDVCNHARDALEHGMGKISLTISHPPEVDATCNSCHERFQGDFVEIAVADDGRGINPVDIEQLFQPFSGANQEHQNGTAELTSANKVIHKHRGHIIVDSIEGYGTTIRLLLPVYAENGANKRTPPRHNANILIVEDEETIANLQSELLKSKGFNTTVFSDSYEALKKFEAAPEEFDCVVIDETMPSLTGIEFSEHALYLRPDLPIILCSTDSHFYKRESLAKLGVRGQLHKPYSSRQLIDEIHRCMQTKDHTQ